MEDLRELKQDVKEILQRTAVHNELLRTHESRSLALQDAQKNLSQRLEPVEHHVKLMNVLAKVLSTVVFGTVVGVLVKLLVSTFH